jgi:hypothetical protein
MFRGQGGDASGAGESASLNNGGLYTTPQSQQETVDHVWSSIQRRASEAVNKDAGENSGKNDPAPASGITGAMTRQGQTEGQLETGGEDKLEVDVFGHWRREAWPLIRGRLDEMRASAESAEKPVMIDVAGTPLSLNGFGKKHGCWFRWTLEWECGRLWVLDHVDGGDKRPGFHVIFDSLPLMLYGLDGCWSRLLQRLAAWGFTVRCDRVSWVDLCVDLPGQAVQPFIDAGLQFAYVSKGRRGAFHYADAHEWEGWSHGTGPVHVRMYDKLREVKASQDWAKWSVLIQKRWGGKEPACATRVEFQLRREILRDRWQMSGVEDYKSKRAQIADWLTSEWFRLVDGVNKDVRENRNQTRCETLPLWKRVAAAFGEWVGRNAIAAVVPRTVLRPSVVAIGKQVSGCVTTVLAMLGRKVASLDELAREGGDLLRLYGNNALQEAAAKAARFEALRGVLLQGSMEGAS